MPTLESTLAQITALDASADIVKRQSFLKLVLGGHNVDSVDSDFAVCLSVGERFTASMVS
jgi:hypothetical protein